jgi:hypothetical protein
MKIRTVRNFLDVVQARREMMERAVKTQVEGV